MLRIENLHAGYNGSEALHSVSIKVERGTIVSVVGANGAGKSTLINSISRLVTVSSGAIWLEDRNIVSLKAAEVVEHGIVQVPEGRQLFAPLTVEENSASRLPPAREKAERRGEFQAAARLCPVALSDHARARVAAGGHDERR